MDRSRVCPILFGIDNNDLRGPLSQFQTTLFTEQEMKKLVSTINDQLGDDKLAPDVLESVFSKWWPDLRDTVIKILDEADSDTGPVRSDRDIIEEILQISRLLAKETDESKESISSKAVNHLLKNFIQIHWNVAKHRPDDKVMEVLKELSKSVDYIAKHEAVSNVNLISQSFEAFKNLPYKCDPYEDNIPF